MSFNPLNYSLCFEEPAFLSDVTSWHEHIPFAFTLMQMLQPGLFVELGTHKGDSYLAFCQAVNTLNLATTCYAVDSWEGDPQAGFYGDEIYQKLKEYHDRHYGGFSSLRKCLFDDALPHFKDQSIDLLHIDGLHTYEAVKHDFETWLPKVSDRGVVLFHDTAVTEEDFGVWQLFKELSSRYPAFEFKHCNGLGILAVGNKVPTPLEPFLVTGPQSREQIAKFYHAIGARISLKHTVRRLETTVASLEFETARLEGDLSERHQQLQDAQGAYQRQGFEVSKMNLQLQDRDLQLQDRERQLQDRERQLQDRDLRLREKEKALADQEQAYLNSLSWKITAPLRRIYELLPKNNKMAVVPATARPLDLKIFSADHRPKEPISLPACEYPEVSIVIPVYNQIDYTLSCLASIVANTDGIEYEVIIADDASTDDTIDIGNYVRNVIHVRNPENLGFLRNCNHAAQKARGKYIHFLNNDTNVHPGWLQSLLTLMKTDSTIGIAGSKLVYPDGMLQEAGGIIWSDASGWNIGWRDDPEKPEYNYVKEVDYISGASILVSRELWEKACNFDENFVPAYYEDTDLAFRARSLGYRVVYQPQSVVVHFEGISHGKDVTVGIKAHQEVNKQRFLERWQDVLQRDHFPNGESVFLARDRSRHRKVVLVIDHYVPMYDRDAGSFFMYSLLRALSALEYKVVFWPDNLYAHQPYTTTLQQLGVEVIVGPHDFQSYLKEYGHFFQAAILTRNHISIDYIDTVRRYIPRVLYHDPDLEFVREGRRLDSEGRTHHGLSSIKEREFYLFRNCDIIGIHSPVERDLILSELPEAEVEVIPLPIQDLKPSAAPFASRSGLLFVGSSHPPNVDGLRFFITEIMPLLQQQIPEITLTVAGDILPHALEDLDLTQVTLTGYVDDLRPLFDQSLVFVVPLRFGAGIKGKVLEAMNYCVPVVTTSIGAEGIGVINGDNILVADSAHLFSQRVAQLHTDPALWEKLSKTGRQYVEENFSQKAFRGKVSEVMNKLLQE